MAEAVNPPERWAPFGALSMAVIRGDGRIVHLKGQVALDRDGHVVGVGDLRAQVRQTLDNIRNVLAALGGLMQDVISLVHYATDIDAFMQAGDIRKTFFAEPCPVTTTVQVERLYRRDLPIEIAAIAEIQRARFRMP
ncbi:endoribonuclease L-PSP [Burkholderia sp. A9]|uniref:RidA family protein n=1 Tax=Burkholderia sp. A9 TaxID=1365108 RepID=UPI000574677B|nr:RidA family protein [Burkholderia sp. A9]KHK59035.1 endoribonuclease L-PSP [Burkholderia sp. A9]